MNFKRVIEELAKRKRLIIIVACVAVFLVCGIWLVSFFIPKDDGLDAYRTFENYTELSEDGIKISGNPIDFTELQKTNPDVCGWISVEGTNIDYPILRSSDDTEEDFYLTHDYMRKENHSGAIYMQKNNSPLFTDTNTVLYGHDLFNNTMFSQLRKFENKDFFKKHVNLYVYTPKHVYTYKIFSITKFDDRHIPSSYHFYDEDSYKSFIDECTDEKKAKNFRKGQLPSFGDKLITLSTCTNNEEERLILVAMRIEDSATK